jgi:acyl-CoA synthetase (NDP forming)
MAQALDRLFRPSSVAIIGASNFDERGGGFLLKGLIKNNFKGKLYPVNPKESEIMGLRGYPTVLDIPEEIDLAIIAVPAQVVPRVMAECGHKGVKFAVIHSAGFAEFGTRGKALEDEVLQLAQQSGMRVVGPNCMGLYCPQVGLNTIVPAAKFTDGDGAIAFLGQSGWVTGNFILMGYERGLTFSKVVSVGNQTDLTIEDFLEYLSADNQTKVIGCYIEGIKRGREFLQLVKEISQKKPVIVWKAGRTEVGIRATASHTGSLAGDSAVFDTALKQSGAVIARNLDELVDLAVGFTCPVLPCGNRVGVVVEAGGGAVAIADRLQALGLEMPILSEKTQQELITALQSSVTVVPAWQNPVDSSFPLNWPTGSTFLQCSRIMSPEVDAIIVVDYALLDEQLATQVAALRDETGKPVIIIPGNPTMRKQEMSRLVRRGIPTFTIPERALKALAAMVSYANYHRGD